MPEHDISRLMINSKIFWGGSLPHSQAVYSTPYLKIKLR